MSESFFRDTWAEINLDAIKENVQNMRKHLPQQTQIMAVVKADGYGHGAFYTAKTAIEAGASWLGVAILDEAIALRKAGLENPILVFGWTRPTDVHLAAKYNISLTAFQKSWILEASEHYTGSAPVFLHLKIDTGMGRIGVKTKEELAELVAAVKTDKRMIAEGVFTHFATADEEDQTYYDKQYHQFTVMLDELKALKVNPNMIHCGNSAASLRHPEKMFNMVRYGISMYGLSPSSEIKPLLPFELKPAFTLYSRLTNVKEIEPGDAIGYGATYKAEKKMWVGTIPIGYADGWLRRLSGRVPVLIDGKDHPIIGRICMDQMMCELDPGHSVGDKVTLIGRDINSEVSIEEIARHLETISYEVTCMISKRVPRLYLKNGKIIHTSNPLLV